MSARPAGDGPEAAAAHAPVQGVDVAAVQEWLAGRLPGLALPLRFTRIGHGRSNLTFRVGDAAGGRVVLRRPPLGPLLPSAHDMAREHRVLTGLARAGAPVPRPLALCDDVAVTGAPFLVMEHVEGVVLHRRAVAARLSGAQRRAMGIALMETLAALHDVDVEAAGLSDLAPRGGYAARQLRRWTRQWEGSKTREVPAMDRVAERLHAAMPPDRGRTLVHGDYRADNVLFAPDGRVNAVLDWELCTLGEPLADLGQMLAYTPAAADDLLPIDDGATLLPGFPRHAELVAAYQRASGRSLEDLPFWTALGYWKIAAILQGVHRRALDGPRGPLGGGPPIDLEPAIDRLAERAEQAASRIARAGGLEL
jgi:aminoglycoside phosphotransferase (APT) family kinase protein